jgi:vacuolar protein sorting-associated protein 45
MITKRPLHLSLTTAVYCTPPNIYIHSFCIMVASSDSFDGVAAIKAYLDRIIHADGKCGSTTMKVFLLDAFTTQVVSAVYSQTDILDQQVYLVERLDQPLTTASTNATNNNSHVKAIVFIRPTSLHYLHQELAHPRYSEYHLFLSNTITKQQLRKLAEQDYQEKIVQVQEFYADLCPLAPDLITLHAFNSLAMTMAAGTSWAPKHAVLYDCHLQGLQAMVLALCSNKRKSILIRHAKQSACAEELAKDLYDIMQKPSADNVFDNNRSFASPNNSGTILLLILDRRDDPVTPLLSQWTYQAMVHELLGLNNHRVILKGAPNIPPDLDEVVLNASQDSFFRDNRHKNFGELGEEIQRLLQEYQQQTSSSANNLTTLADMQAFMDRFPELKSQSHVVSKHVAIMGELARLVQVCSLMDVSQLEQELACSDDYQTHWRDLNEKLSSSQIKLPDKLRLGLLFALRYEQSGNMHMVQSAMSKAKVPYDLVQLLPVMLRYAGTQSRGPGLYGDQQHAIMNKMKSLMTSVQGVDNVYTQHVPVLMDTLQAIAKGKLTTKTHPFVGASSNSSASHKQSQQQPLDLSNVIPQEILVFMVGGVTYEEATKVAEWNVTMKGRIKVILAGSTVHNSTSFLEELKATER